MGGGAHASHPRTVNNRMMVTLGAAAWALFSALGGPRLLAMHFGDLALAAPAFCRITPDLCAAAITQVARNEKLGQLIIFFGSVS